MDPLWLIICAGLPVLYVLAVLRSVEDARRAVSELSETLPFIRREVVGILEEVNELLRGLEERVDTKIGNEVEEMIRDIRGRIDGILNELDEYKERVRSERVKEGKEIRKVIKSADKVIKTVKSSVINMRSELKNDYSKLLSRVMYLDKHVADVKHDLMRVNERLESIENELKELWEVIKCNE